MVEADLNLPGFYFDPDRNRYFPLPRKQGRAIPEKIVSEGSSSRQGTGQPEGEDGEGEKGKGGERDGVLQLVHGRELFGGSRSSASHNSTAFRRRFLEAQASHPQVWEYSGTHKWADGALQQLRVSSQTKEGEKEADVVVLGGSSGRFGLCITSLRSGDEEAEVFYPRRCAPSDGHVWIPPDREPPGFSSSIEARFSSGITAIKRLGEGSDAGSPEDSAHLQRNALHSRVTTLGSAEVSGSLYVLSLKQGPEIREWDHNYPFPFQMSMCVKTGCSVWTAEGSPKGTAASLGMSTGVALVALERSDLSWLCRGSSAVLSQQFDKVGNVILSGFRNGVISTIDLRVPPPKSSSHETFNSPSGRGSSGRQSSRNESISIVKAHPRRSYFGGKVGGNQGKQTYKSRVDDYFCSHSKVMRMESAICSMALLRHDENYLLASAMNGNIQQWDRRVVERGAVWTYEGHCNTHTRLQLGVDPTETFVVSGGEDCVVRIWSLASGRLLHAEKGVASPATCVCWPASLSPRSQLQGGGYLEEPPFEADHTWGLWLGSSSGLYFMHGAASWP